MISSALPAIGAWIGLGTRAARAALYQDQRRLPGDLAAPARHVAGVGGHHDVVDAVGGTGQSNPARDLRRRRDDRRPEARLGEDAAPSGIDQADRRSVQIPSAGEEVGARIGNVVQERRADDGGAPHRDQEHARCPAVAMMVPAFAPRLHPAHPLQHRVHGFVAMLGPGGGSFGHRVRTWRVAHTGEASAAFFVAMPGRIVIALTLGGSRTRPTMVTRVHASQTPAYLDRGAVIAQSGARRNAD